MGKIDELKAAAPDVRINVMTGLVFLVIFVPGVILAVRWKNPAIMVAFLVAALIAAMSPRIAQQWEKCSGSANSSACAGRDCSGWCR